MLVVGYAGCDWKPKDLRTWVVLPGGWDVYPCLILKTSNITDEMFRLMEAVSPDNPIIYRGVLLLNQKPNLKVITVRTDVVNWVRLEKKDHKLCGPFPLTLEVSFPLMFRDIKVETIQREVFNYMFPPLSNVLGLYMCKRRFWLAFLLAPRKQKFYFLIMGHWLLFKRICKKLIHLDFSVKSLN